MWAMLSSTITGMVSRWARLANCARSEGDGACRGASVAAARINANAIARTMPQSTKNHGQPARSAITEASTWPKMPATRNEVDIAPIAPARLAGATASAR